MRLLIGDADQVGELLLGQAQHDPALAHPGADVVIDILGTPGRAARRRGAIGRVAVLAAVPTRFDAGILLGHLGPLDEVVSSGLGLAVRAYMASGNGDV